MKDRKIKLGVVGVDSGHLLICDPCYLDCHSSLKFENITGALGLNSGNPKKWQKFAQLKYDLGHVGAGVVFESGLGDGVYEVWAKVGKVNGLGERIKEVIVKLIS